jgi:hypothetical protein
LITGSVWFIGERKATTIPAPKPGEWFTEELIVHGSDITVIVNSKETAHFVDKNTIPPGHIALEVRDARTTAEFESVEVKELPASDLSSSPVSASGKSADVPVVETKAAVGANNDSVALFNGKDLTGWNTDAKDRSTWTVQRGVLTGKGAAPCFLFTDRADFEDVHVRVKTRINNGGNSGVFVRWGGIGREPDYEAQIDSTAKDPHRTGSIYNGGFLRRDASAPPPPPGQWFVEEIIAQGDQVTVIVDGKQVASFDDSKHIPRGRVCLQIHGAGTSVEFASVEIKELSPTKESPKAVSDRNSEQATVGSASSPNEDGFVSLFNGKDLRGWIEAVDSFEVVDGAIRCKPGHGGDLLTKDTFRNFIVRLEYHLPHGAVITAWHCARK